jgi:hypothetical protein
MCSVSWKEYVATMEAEMARKHPMRREPMSTAERAGNVTKDLVRLKGQSRADLERDDMRGAGSPLGMGTHSKREMERRGGRR